MSVDRVTPIEMSRQEFIDIGYQLVDRIAAFIDTIREKPVTTGELPHQLQQFIGADGLPADGVPADILLSRAADLLFSHSLLNGHPKFLGYITHRQHPLVRWEISLLLPLTQTLERIY